MNSALQPQLLKLEEVFDETVKAGTTIQEELKSAILLRCVGGHWMLIASKMPKEKVRRARMTIRKAKVKILRAKERKEKEIRKEGTVITRAKVKAKTRKAKVWQHVTLVESQDSWLKTVGGTLFDR